MPSLEHAIALAASAHSGQVDKAGQPYILHPLRLMLAVTTPDERMAAVLHDVVEDTAITLAQCRRPF
ncbi:MAG: HD domain-containing protein [Propionivibrio sp.]|nr:HD domain-containing protein [Propionivibrio sp.]